MLTLSGVMFSIARSRYTILVQFLFYAFNALGLFLGTVYNAKTPDLYENNAHHKMGWIFTWIATAWLVLGILRTYTLKSKNGRLSISEANMARYERLQQSEDDAQGIRYSRDSGQGTERNSASLFGSGSPSTESEQLNFGDHLERFAPQEQESEQGEAEKPRILRNTWIDRFLARNVQRFAIGKTLTALRISYVIIERSIILLSFVAITSGFVAWGGVFVSWSPCPGPYPSIGYMA
jgi:hypothetical protein